MTFLRNSMNEPQPEDDQDTTLPVNPFKIPVGALVTLVDADGGDERTVVKGNVLDRMLRANGYIEKGSKS